MTRTPRSHKPSELVLRDETRWRQIQRRVQPPSEYGTPGTDFATALVPRTTIPKATRIIQTGSDAFLPGIGTAYLFRVNDSGVLEPWRDSDGTVIWKTVYNFADSEFQPNADLAPPLELMDGNSLTLMGGETFSLMRQTGSTDYIGSETAVLPGIMDRRGMLTIPRDSQTSSTAPVLQPIRLERAIVAQENPIKPDREGDIELYTDQLLDDNPQAAAAGSITLAVTASAVNGFYTGWQVRIVSGAGAGQTRWIHSYNTSRVATIGAFGGQISYDFTEVPNTSSVYKLLKPSVKKGIWSFAENGQVLTPWEEILVQRSTSSAAVESYDIVRGMNRDVQRAVVTQSGGILDGETGQIRLTEDGQETWGIWDFATASKHIKRLTDVYVRFEDTNPFQAASTLDQGRRYRIIGVDCSGLVDSPGDL